MAFKIVIIFAAFVAVNAGIAPIADVHAPLAYTHTHAAPVAYTTDLHAHTAPLAYSAGYTHAHHAPLAYAAPVAAPIVAKTIAAPAYSSTFRYQISKTAFAAPVAHYDVAPVVAKTIAAPITTYAAAPVVAKTIAAPVAHYDAAPIAAYNTHAHVAPVAYSAGYAHAPLAHTYAAGHLGHLAAPLIDNHHHIY